MQTGEYCLCSQQFVENYVVQEPLAISNTETLHLAIYIHCNQGQSTCTTYSLKYVNNFTMNVNNCLISW